MRRGFPLQILVWLGRGICCENDVHVSVLTPWFDTECRAMRRDCRRLERRYRRSKSDIDRSKFAAALRRKHTSFTAKKNKYWTERISAERGTPAKLWQSLTKLLRRDKELDSSSTSHTHSADQFIQFFGHKVETIRKDTENCPPPCLLYTSDAADE